MIKILLLISFAMDIPWYWLPSAIGFSLLFAWCIVEYFDQLEEFKKDLKAGKL